MGLFVSNYNFQRDSGKNGLLLSTRNLSSSKWFHFFINIHENRLTKGQSGIRHVLYL